MDRLHTTREIHGKFGLTVASLREWVKLTRKTHTQIGPIFRKIRGLIYYQPADVKRWIEQTEEISNRSKKYAG